MKKKLWDRAVGMGINESLVTMQMSELKKNVRDGVKGISVLIAPINAARGVKRFGCNMYADTLHSLGFPHISRKRFDLENEAFLIRHGLEKAKYRRIELLYDFK